MTNNHKKVSLWPLLLIGVPSGILLAEYVLKPVENKIENKIKTGSVRVSARDLADKYNASRAAARNGDARAQSFIQAANRKIMKIKDDAALGDVYAQKFLEELKARGVAESDYSK